MKTICFCANIHIPPPKFYCRFFHIRQNHANLSCPEIETYYKQVCSSRLVPWLKLLNKLISESDGKLKLTLSISGSTLMKLKEYNPDALVLMGKLLANRQIDFFAVPYSHSLLSYANSEYFRTETEKHQLLLKDMFGSQPEVYLLPTAFNSKQLLKSITEINRSAAIVYHGKFSDNQFQIPSEECGWQTPKLFPINCQLSYILQNGLCGIGKKSVESSASALYSKFMKHFPSSDPEIVIYNPLNISPDFQLIADSIFAAFLKKLVKKTDTTFLLPSQLPKHTFVFDTSMPKKDAKPVAGLYLKNKLQKEAFRFLQKVEDCTGLDSPELWEVINDMEYLRYMSLKFVKPSFVKRYFNPYSSPYMAYLSYMNILENIWMNQQDKTAFSRKSNVSVNT